MTDDDVKDEGAEMAEAEAKRIEEENDQEELQVDSSQAPSDKEKSGNNPEPIEVA